MAQFNKVQEVRTNKRNGRTLQIRSNVEKSVRKKKTLSQQFLQM
jgi:hypothetical protein